MKQADLKTFPSPKNLNQSVELVMAEKYKYGFITDIESDTAPKGLNEDIVRFISAKKNEPSWLLDWRLKAFRFWQTMVEPTWAKLNYSKIDYQDAHYYSAPKSKPSLQSMDEIDPKIRQTYEKLGIPLHEQQQLSGVAVLCGASTAFPLQPLFGKS